MEVTLILDDKEARHAHAKLLQALMETYDIDAISSSVPACHIDKSPRRVADTFFEMFKGCWEEPASYLDVTFDEAGYDEIVYVNDISFVSMCAHHNLPFFGRMHFGYLPSNKVVGLSKIPRLVQGFARRPQIQEILTCQIVDTFNEKLEPRGCGLVVEAYHLCMSIRGVESKPTYTKTAALRGMFKSQLSTKQEFLDGIRKTTSQIWP